MNRKVLYKYIREACVEKLGGYISHKYFENAENAKEFIVEPSLE